MTYDYLFSKILFFSEEGVGKTTFVNRYCIGFDADYKKTIGAHIFKLKQDVNFRGDNYSIAFWDISERNSMKRILCQGAEGAILMYDITNKNSTNKFLDWIVEIKDYCGEIPILIVGNKLDLKEDRADVRERIMKLKEEYNLSSEIDISVEKGENIDKMLEELIKAIIEPI